MRKIRIIIAIIVASMVIPGLATAGDPVLICNPSVQESALSKQELKNIFLGKKTTWKDNSKAIFVIQKNAPVHKVFLKKYVDKTTSQFANYWKKRVFTGKGASPQSLPSDQEVIKFVSETSGAVGYVSSGVGLDNVKTIKVK